MEIRYVYVIFFIVILQSCAVGFGLGNYLTAKDYSKQIEDTEHRCNGVTELL